MNRPSLWPTRARSFGPRAQNTSLSKNDINIWSSVRDVGTFSVCNRVELGDPSYNFNGRRLNNTILADSKKLPPTHPYIGLTWLKNVLKIVVEGCYELGLSRPRAAQDPT